MSVRNFQAIFYSSKTKTPLCIIFWHISHTMQEMGLYGSTHLKKMGTSTGAGIPTQGKNMKPSQINSFLHYLKGGISWLVWFTLRLPCCPAERTGRALSLQHWFPQKGTVAGAKSAVIPAVGLWGYEKASPIFTCEMGVVRTE